MGVVAYSATSGIPSVQFESRVLQESIAEWRRRKNIQEIAKQDGAKEIRVLTTGHSELTGLYSSRLQSTSFIFLASETPPEGNWLKITDPEKTKILLEFHLPDSIVHREKVEISLADLFSGKQLPDDIRKEWSKSFQLWSNTRPWHQQYLTDKGIQNLQIEAYLLRGREMIPLGPLATGKSAKMLVGSGLMQRAINTGRTTLGLSTHLPEISTKNKPVVRSADCISWYEKISGKKILIEN
jgi:hypothetical protein